MSLTATSRYRGARRILRLRLRFHVCESVTWMHLLGIFHLGLQTPVKPLH